MGLRIRGLGFRAWGLDFGVLGILGLLWHPKTQDFRPMDDPKLRHSPWDSINPRNPKPPGNQPPRSSELQILEVTETPTLQVREHVLEDPGSDPLEGWPLAESDRV